MTLEKTDEEKRKIIDFVKDRGTPTGSYYFGYVYNDMDYVMRATAFQEFLVSHSLQDNNFIPTLYVEELKNFPDGKPVNFLSVKIELDGVKYDIILVGSSEFMVWKNATYDFEKMIKESPTLKKHLSLKENRVAVFEDLKEYWRNNK